MNEERTFRKLADHVRESLLPALRQSAHVIHIGADIGSADVKAAVELGFALLLNKPLIVIRDPARDVSPAVLRAADCVIEGDLMNPADKDRIQAELGAFIEAWKGRMQ